MTKKDLIERLLLIQNHLNQLAFHVALAGEVEVIIIDVAGLKEDVLQSEGPIE